MLTGDPTNSQVNAASVGRLHGADWGWVAILGFAATHNIWAAGRGKEMLSAAARRHRVARPLLVPAATLGLWAHLMGWLPSQADPLHQLGVLAEHVADLARKASGTNPRI